MPRTVVIGAGPAGLSAAYAVAEGKREVIVMERDPQYVGGLSRTMQYRGYRFDIGGHRFYSKSSEVTDFWEDILGDELLTRRRLSRIYFNGKFFLYPLRAWDALAKLGPFFAAQCMCSYALARLHPRQPVRSFEDWVVNSFGEKLYRTFFKSYTEKVWGIPCTELSADWAAQRIKGLSLWALVKNLFALPAPRRQKSKVIKTLIESFSYPRLGPGQMWEKLAEVVVRRGGQILMDARVTRIEWGQTGGFEVEAVRQDGRVIKSEAEHVISSMPLPELVEALVPAPPVEVLESARKLSYRDFLTVALILDRAELFPDNWIYIHDPDVKVGRIQNYKNWSEALVADASRTCLGMEYFCFKGDALWESSDAELIEMAGRELVKLGLGGGAAVEHAAVVRMANAYPVYDDLYRRHLTTVRGFIDAHLPNLQLVGRNGMHRYNNQDHAIMTGFLAARNVLAGCRKFDPWRVNQDALYLEEIEGDKKSG
jgi:protoporphyrinogen oxidase